MRSWPRPGRDRVRIADRSTTIPRKQPPRSSTRAPPAGRAAPPAGRGRARTARGRRGFTPRGTGVAVRLLPVPPRGYRERVARVDAALAGGGPSIIINAPNPDRMLRPGTPAV